MRKNKENYIEDNNNIAVNIHRKIKILTIKKDIFSKEIIKQESRKVVR